MFGWEIDLADFTTPDADSLDHKPDAQHPAYDRSYSSSYATIYGVQPRLSEPDLPPKAEFMHYAGAAVNVLNPYTPVLQKNRFFAMVSPDIQHANTFFRLSMTFLAHSLFSRPRRTDGCRSMKSMTTQRSLQRLFRKLCFI